MVTKIYLGPSIFNSISSMIKHGDRQDKKAKEKIIEKGA